MKINKCLKNTFLIILLIGIFASGSNLFGMIFGNGSGCVYCSAPTESAGFNNAPCSNNLINLHIEEGAASFLSSYAIMLQVMSKMELINQQGFDNDEFKLTVNMARTKVREAIQSYKQIIELAESTPYNPDIVASLQNLDYISFKAGNNMNDSIFCDVQDYLQNGDVTGAYRWIYENLLTISRSLDTLSESLGSEAIPQAALFWDLNKKYNHTVLFGQYMAEVFYSLLESTQNGIC